MAMAETSASFFYRGLYCQAFGNGTLYLLFTG
jgi:hypothetical protein